MPEHGVSVLRAISLVPLREQDTYLFDKVGPCLSCGSDKGKAQSFLLLRLRAKLSDLGGRQSLDVRAVFQRAELG